MKTLYLSPNQFENIDIDNQNNLYLFPSALLDREDCKFRELPDSSLLNYRLTVAEFNKEFEYLNQLTYTIIDLLSDLFNTYYSINKTKKFWLTLLLPDIRDVLELVYARYLQLSSIEGKVKVELIENCRQFLVFNSSRLQYVNVNFISTVDWALSSFILLHSDLKNKVEARCIHVQDIQLPHFKYDKEYYQHVIEMESKRIETNRGNIFPYYVSFPKKPVSVFLGTGIKSNRMEDDLNSNVRNFSAYYSGIPLFKNAKKRKLIATIKKKFLLNDSNSFEKFFISNIDTFFPQQFFDLRLPAKSNIKVLSIGLPVATISDAESRENGGLSFGIQHGTAYGMYTSGTQEWTERNASDGFLTWGWADNVSSLPTIPMPSPHLSTLLNNNDSLHQNSALKVEIGIIFNTTYNRVGKFLRVAMPFFLKENLELLNKILKLTIALPKEEILVSEYAFEQGYNLKLQLDQVLVSSSKIKFERMAGEKLLLNSELLISNSFGTSFFERLVINKPILIFNDFFEIENYNKDWLEIVDSLIKVGIYNIDSASFENKLRLSKEEILNWWNSPEIQELRDSMLKKIAWTDKNWEISFLTFIRAQLNHMESNIERISVPFFVKLCSRVYFRIKGLFL
ncbi:hypothetical protein [Leptospira bouyouniensis]|uniref:hypothetical protein n=1 Tax=Leptospira bouyouniensis TaxID=2484911 RepID=UPI0010914BE1|nr:hypothetical protein [Leptospira bouyouniensis]TGM80955.1 hypothetical protein EHQ99_15080 [Leptospira bouyouniensis]